jgi:hypothetical protein
MGMVMMVAMDQRSHLDFNLTGNSAPMSMQLFGTQEDYSNDIREVDAVAGQKPVGR